MLNFKSLHATSHGCTSRALAQYRTERRTKGFTACCRVVSVKTPPSSCTTSINATCLSVSRSVFNAERRILSPKLRIHIQSDLQDSRATKLTSSCTSSLSRNSRPGGPTSRLCSKLVCGCLLIQAHSRKSEIPQDYQGATYNIWDQAPLTVRFPSSFIYEDVREAGYQPQLDLSSFKNNPWSLVF